ncbi:GFA family protein [Massilia glaciei]|uniref:GFA family protein n=1 Tax=Massilia glaciei TaxID=1524097 RepID=A0A2U2HHF1_9BURK|nr:GFA family protein [Massilia glaciei]PWF45099.1 GFA family protein [Massilia glaciei]
MFNGGCFCGAVRYRASAQRVEATICHCTICRRTTGAPFVAWFSLPAADFTVLAGTPSALRSSTHATRTFCAACGTQLTFIDDATPGEVDVTIGSLDEPDLIAPADHTFTRGKLAWVRLADDLPQFQASRANG